MRKKAVVLIPGISLILFLLLEWFYIPLEGKIYDFLQYLTASEQPEVPVVIVDIDNRSLNELGRFQNWPRYYFAQVLKNIRKDNPKIIAFDILFTEPDTMPGVVRKILREKLGPLGDSAFYLLSFDRALEKELDSTPAVILPFFFTDEFSTPSPSFLRYRVLVEGINPPSFPGVVSCEERFLKKNVSVGFINAFPDRDGTLRRCYLFGEWNGNIFPHLSLAIAERLRIDWRKLPFEKDGSFFIKFTGPFHTFPYVSFTDVYHGRIPDGYFKNRIVLIGTSATGLSDRFNVPVGIMPGVEIHANVIDNLRKGEFLKVVPLHLRLIIMLVFSLFLTVLSTSRRMYLSFILFILALILFPVISLFLFFNNIYLEMTRIEGIILFSYIAGTILTMRETEKEKRKIRELFSRYLPERVIDEMVEKMEIPLGGERREITVLFSDIRNFTSLSEKRDPADVVSDLNEFFNEMTECIFKYDGMVDKFLGDGIMAIFGAPVPVPGHAEKAVMAALEMVERAERLKKKWKTRGKRGFDIGIGIHTGVAVVGNVGSSKRMEYTAIGDTVNLAARLEPLNKEYGTRIIISETTKRQIKDFFILRDLGSVKVKGKRAEVKIYEVISRK